MDQPIDSGQDSSSVGLLPQLFSAVLLAAALGSAILLLGCAAGLWSWPWLQSLWQSFYAINFYWPVLFFVASRALIHPQWLQAFALASAVVLPLATLNGISQVLLATPSNFQSWLAQRVPALYAVSLLSTLFGLQVLLLFHPRFARALFRLSKQALHSLQQAESYPEAELEQLEGRSSYRNPESLAAPSVPPHSRASHSPYISRPYTPSMPPAQGAEEHADAANPLSGDSAYPYEQLTDAKRQGKAPSQIQHTEPLQPFTDDLTEDDELIESLPDNWRSRTQGAEQAEATPTDDLPELQPLQILAEQEEPDELAERRQPEEWPQPVSPPVSALAPPSPAAEAAANQTASSPAALDFAALKAELERAQPSATDPTALAAKPPVDPGLEALRSDLTPNQVEDGDPTGRRESPAPEALLAVPAEPAEGAWTPGEVGAESIQFALNQASLQRPPFFNQRTEELDSEAAPSGVLDTEPDHLGAQRDALRQERILQRLQQTDGQLVDEEMAAELLRRELGDKHQDLANIAAPETMSPDSAPDWLEETPSEGDGEACQLQSQAQDPEEAGISLQDWLAETNEPPAASVAAPVLPAEGDKQAEDSAESLAWNELDQLADEFADDISENLAPQGQIADEIRRDIQAVEREIRHEIHEEADQGTHPEAPHPEAPHIEAPHIEASHIEASHPEAPYPEAPYPEAPYPEAPYPEAPYPEAPYPEAPYPEASHPEASHPEAPYTEAPYTEAPYTEASWETKAAVGRSASAAPAEPEESPAEPEESEELSQQGEQESRGEILSNGDWDDWDDFDSDSPEADSAEPEPQQTGLQTHAATVPDPEDASQEFPTAELDDAWDIHFPQAAAWQPAEEIGDAEPPGASEPPPELEDEASKDAEEMLDIPEVPELHFNGAANNAGPAQSFSVAQAAEQALLQQEEREASQEEERAQKMLAPPVKRTWQHYQIPIKELLHYDPKEEQRNTQIDAETRQDGEALLQTLKKFKIDAEMTHILRGPSITEFGILPAPGIKLSRVEQLADNLAMELAARSIRIVAPIPGKKAVGIEIPNRRRSTVSFAALMDSETMTQARREMRLPVVLGKEINGEVQVADLRRTPHLLIAGATGAGKSVCVNTIISSLILSRPPQALRLLMIDPKIVELKQYNDIPHLLTPVITDPQRALQALQWVSSEMERRYSLLDAIGAGNKGIDSYNRYIHEKNMATVPLEYIVVIVDEFADLMSLVGKELEGMIARLAAMSRAVGIHLVLATQRPSVDVVTGLIKANFPTRIAFMVASQTDSRTILDIKGAEQLLGQGDMLFSFPGHPLMRIQGAYLSEEEVESISVYVQSLGQPAYLDEIIFEDEGSEDTHALEDGSDELFSQALEIALQAGEISTSFLQRKLSIGYNRAARIIDEMEARGIVGPSQGSKKREVLQAV